MEGIVYADLEMGIIELANYLTDPAGHYSRPDVYSFTIDVTKRRAVNQCGESNETYIVTEAQTAEETLASVEAVF